MTGHLVGFATATKDEGGEMKRLSIDLVCKQDGSAVSCVTPGGDYKWTGTYANQHLELGIERNGEFMKLSGDVVTWTKIVTTFKGTMKGRYRRLMV
jgi:hypothetical protein